MLIFYTFRGHKIKYNTNHKKPPNSKPSEIHDLAATGSLLLSRVLSRIRKLGILLTGDWKRDLFFLP